MNPPINILHLSLLFLLIFMAGYWLRWSGKPYGTLLLNVHKLLALGVSIYLAIKIFRLNEVGALTGNQLFWGLTSGVLLLVSGLIGGVVSLDRPVPRIFGWLHNILPFAVVGALSMFLSRLP